MSNLKQQRTRTEGQTELEGAPTLPLTNGVKPDDAGGTLEVSADDTTADANTNTNTNKTRAPETTKAMRDLRNAEHLELKEYLQNTLQGATQFQIGVHRLKPDTVRHPRTGLPIKAAGHLKTYAEFIDETTLRENHGGGTFLLRIRAPNAQGKFTFVTSRQVDVAGTPNIEELLAADASAVAEQPAAASSGESPSLVKQAFDMAREQAEQARHDRDAAIERASRGPRSEGISMHDISGAIDRAIAPFKHQVDILMAQLASKDQVIADLQKREPPRDEFKDTMLKRLVEDDSARLQAVRAQYESEIRILKEGEQSRIERAIERAERDRASHEREIASLRALHETASSATKSAHEMTVNLMKEEIRRNERAIDKLDKELSELKAKKDKTLLEQVKDIKALKEGLSDDDDDSGEKSLLDRAAEILSPEGMQAVGAVVSAVRGQAAQPGAQQAAQAAVPKVVQNASGERFVVRGNQLIPAKRRDAAAPQTQQQPAAPPAEVVPAATVPDAQINDTVHRLELAFHNEMEPENVAELARDQIPPEVLDAIRQHGLDVILHKRAKLSSSSPFTTQNGRNWIRKLGKALVGD